MDGVLSQEEINALLSGGTLNENQVSGEQLTEEEIDTIGELANICMGTSATTLSTLVNQKVDISTPVVSMATWSDLVDAYEKPCVFIRISYTTGLDGNNLLILKEHDVKVITDLMMGGNGENVDGEITELHLSAISEAMNQMMGSAATSLSSMLCKKIDISPPTSDLISMTEPMPDDAMDNFLKENFVSISFHMVIEGLVDSEMMQLYPIELAKSMCETLKQNTGIEAGSTVNETIKQEEPVYQQPVYEKQPMPAQPQAVNENYANNYQPHPPVVENSQPVNIQPAQFQPFSNSIPSGMQKENIDLIMDVPLEVTVELGRTKKSIQEILDFTPGTIIELNKIAGEPIDILVNGKYVAKGEVVVIEESFGVRITEILK